MLNACLTRVSGNGVYRALDVLRLERHSLGPRVYLLGLRIHEVAVGLVMLSVLLLGSLVEMWEPGRVVDGVGVVGGWLVVKDWRDLFPSRRNTARWSLLLHRADRRRPARSSPRG